MADSSRDQGQGRESPPLSEWLVAGFGVLIVLAALGFLGYEAVDPGETPPDIVNRTVAIRPTTGGYLVQVEVRNRGGETAAGVTLEGTLNEGDREVEASEATLDYVPGRSQREAGLFFSEDPRRYRLELRAFGYQEP